MNGTTIEKDMGILIDEELKFHKHVSATVTKANQSLGIIKRNFDTLDKELLPTVHQVRPHLEYGHALWLPLYIKDMKKSWRSKE